MLHSTGALCARFGIDLAATTLVAELDCDAASIVDIGAPLGQCGHGESRVCDG